MLEALRARVFDLLRHRRSLPPPAYHELVRDVVVVASAPRSGSSVFAELLRRRMSGQLHLQGEMVPQLALAGLRFPDTVSGSDALFGPVEEEALAVVRELLGVEIGVPVDALDASAFEDYAVDLAVRLNLQWPAEAFTLPEVLDLASRALDDLRREHGWATGSFGDHELFQAYFLRHVCARHPAVDPRYYDLPPELVAPLQPGLPAGPPADLLVEMPPFVLIEPRRAATADELAGQTLVLKTTSNTYRLDLIPQLFPNAEVRILHLTRNPAACVNGLIDGWRHHGFFAVPVGGLDIAGYSDEFPEWGRTWWNFDLPPGWRAVAGRPLTEVCAFQWRAAQECILGHVGRTGQDHMRLKFEELVGCLGHGGGVPRDLVGWLGGAIRPNAEQRIAPVMATQPPSLGRWQRRQALICDVVRDECVLSLARALDYGGDPQAWT